MADKTYTLTDEQFAQLLARTGAPAAPQGPAPSPDEQMRAQLAAIRSGGQEPPPVSGVRCTSPDTGSTFIAILFRGKVVRLEDYARPASAAKHVAEGGRVPDGLTINDRNGQPTALFRQWAWTEFWKADLSRFNGKDEAWIRRFADDVGPV